MKVSSRYHFEYLFLAIVIFLSITGFWDIYFGVDSNPTLYQHLHVATNFAWLSLLLLQLSLIARNKHGHHKRIGLSILVIGPLLVATTSLLTVHSAHKGLVSGRGDFLIVQNVMVTLELGLIILLAFVVRKRRKLHGYFLLSTAILMMGIALFFSLIAFVPALKIEGPETFYRFGTAAMTGAFICLVVGLLFLIRDWRNGWPLLLAGSFFVLNELLKSMLTEHQLIAPLTQAVGSMNQSLTFFGIFAVLLALLAATGIRISNQGRA